MTDERDPGLQALFDSATRIEADDTFVASIMADIDGARRQTVISWVVAGLLFMPLAWWLTGPVLHTFNVVGELLPDSLFSFDREWLTLLLAPVNGAAGIAGIVFLGIWTLYRKIGS
jgi:hypothetical protein